MPGAEQGVIHIRAASPDDAAELLEIYAPYVRETAISFEYEVPALEEFRARITATLARYPYLAAERGGARCSATPTAARSRAAPPTRSPPRPRYTSAAAGTAAESGEGSTKRFSPPRRRRTSATSTPTRHTRTPRTNI